MCALLKLTNAPYGACHSERVGEAEILAVEREGKRGRLCHGDLLLMMIIISSSYIVQTIIGQNKSWGSLFMPPHLNGILMCFGLIFTPGTVFWLVLLNIPALT